VRGEFTIKYKDREEAVRAGEVYHIEPGHNVVHTPGTEIIELSPLDEYQKTMDVVMRNYQAMQEK
jgi:mannose-6-phosphate isomerase-like protein (cupin superfamily)